MATDFYTIGPLSIDYLLTADGILHPAQLGGGAVYSAVGARFITDSVSIISTVNTTFPRHHLEDLQQFGISTQGIMTQDSSKTPTIFSAFNSDFEREEVRPTAKYQELAKPIPKAFLSDGPAHNKRDHRWDLDCAPAALPAAIAHCDAVHFAGVSHRTIKRFGRFVKQLRKPIVSFDPPSSLMKRDFEAELKLALHDVDIFLASERQCREFFRPEVPSLWQMAHTFARMGPNTVVIKRGEHGQALFSSNQSNKWFMPAYPTQPVDLTGAGHTFAGAFTAAFARDDGDILRAAASASAAGSIAVEGVGYSFPLDSAPGLFQARRDRILEGVYQA